MSYRISDEEERDNQLRLKNEKETNTALQRLYILMLIVAICVGIVCSIQI
jgi:hypothetical protein